MFFSPDGAYLAYDLRSSDATALRDIFVIAVDGSREIAPQLRVRGSRIFFLSEIFHYGVAQRAFRAGRQDSEMFREGFDMSIILRGVELQSLAAKLARLPILVKRMLQEILLGDCGIEPRKEFGVSHGYLRHADGAGPREARIVADSG